MADIDDKAIGIAAGAIAAAILDALHDKGILTLDEARGVLDKAKGRIGTRTPEGMAAAKIIMELLRTRFPARNG